MDNLFSSILKAYSDGYKKATEQLISEGRLVKEEDTLLLPGTIELVKEIEAAQIHLAIDKALEERDFDTCRKLVALCK
ncbi:MAG TPA: hypothetical protein VNQ57_09710 [Ureibacillus sp.]|nr:hypothetical protein [Ureibacillus sp.]